MALTLAERQQQDAARRDAVAEAVAHADLGQYQPVTDALAGLSARTEIDGIEVVPEGVLFDEDRFRGIFNLYLVLDYSAGSRAGPRLSESLEGKFEGHFAGDAPKIDRMTVDAAPLRE